LIAIALRALDILQLEALRQLIGHHDMLSREWAIILDRNREDEIIAKEKEANDLKRKYFAPDGELYKKREALVKPIQDEIYNAVQEICEQQGYQVVLDKSSTNNLIFASPKIDISDQLLEKLGYSK
jgi:outer membrane protein